MASHQPHQRDAADPLDRAKAKTADVKDELEIAGAELHLANTALNRQLPASDKGGDVDKALRQTAAVEDKLSEAAEELHDVKDLLESEIAEKERLEGELQRARSGH